MIRLTDHPFLTTDAVAEFEKHAAGAGAIASLFANDGERHPASRRRRQAKMAAHGRSHHPQDR